MSQSVAIRYWEMHPAQAPSPLGSRLSALSAAAGGGGQHFDAAVAAGDQFNLDRDGLPQNEESVGVCGRNGRMVLGGTNDYRGLLRDPRDQDFTGWSFSADSGASVANEGLLPHLRFPDGRRVPSGGDPVDVADGRCRLFASTLNFDFGSGHPHSGIGVYRSDPAALVSCPGRADSSCWPIRKVVAVAPRRHFYDKDWMDVGRSGAAGEVVWVVFTDFRNPFSSSIKAVRCNRSLKRCTKPIRLSGHLAGQGLPIAQFGYVVIGPDGRTYVLWSEIHHGLFARGHTHMVFKLRVAAPGSTTFGPERVVARERKPLWTKNPLHANDFRVATIPKMTVMMVSGRPKIFVAWDRCTSLDPQPPTGPEPPTTVCEEPTVVVSHSHSNGRRWSPRQVLSAGGDNYFPTISGDPSGDLVAAWYTSRFDPVFHNQQDVEMVKIDPLSGSVLNRVRVTPSSNEPEADPTIFGNFIGDYFQILAHKGAAYVHFNANYRSVPYLGRGLPIPQQDNFLQRLPL
jgi:hypothetical protein